MSDGPIAMLAWKAHTCWQARCLFQTTRWTNGSRSMVSKSFNFRLTSTVQNSRTSFLRSRPGDIPLRGGVILVPNVARASLPYMRIWDCTYHVDSHSLWLSVSRNWISISIRLQLSITFSSPLHATDFLDYISTVLPPAGISINQHIKATTINTPSLLHHHNHVTRNNPELA